VINIVILTGEYYMRISEFITEEELSALDEKATRKLCLSTTPNEHLGASNLSSCKAQGFRAREGKKRHWYHGKRVPSAGLKIKSKKYGGTV
jgi:hypothetical protein